MAPSSRLLALALVFSGAASCKSTNKGRSDLDSDIVGNDCNSARQDLTLQQGKLVDVRTAFLDTYDRYEASQRAAPSELRLAETEDDTRDKLVDAVKSREDCNTLLTGAGTGAAASAFADVYQTCVDYYNVLAKIKTREDRVKQPDCQQGADTNIATVFVSSCDTPCFFTNVECGLVELQAGTARHRFACGSKRAAVDAARGYCREFRVADADCRVGEPRLVKGSEIATPAAQIAGSSSETLSLRLQAFAGPKAQAEYTGGVVVEGEVGVKFQAQGGISLSMENDTRAVKVGEFLAAGTKAACKINVTAFVEAGTRAFVGVGGSFKVFGNGVEARAGIEGGLSLTLERAVEQKLGEVDAGGLEASVVVQRCVPLAIRWLENELTGLFGPFAEQLRGKVTEFKDAQERIRQEAERFMREGRGMTSRDTESSGIFCLTTKAGTTESYKTYRIVIARFGLSTDAILAQVSYDGYYYRSDRVAPRAGQNHSISASALGEARYREIRRKLFGGSTNDLSIDDIRRLVEQIPGDGFGMGDCSKTAW